jgi:hypothetical protein
MVMSIKSKVKPSFQYDERYFTLTSKVSKINPVSKCPYISKGFQKQPSNPK